MTLFSSLSSLLSLLFSLLFHTNSLLPLSSFYFVLFCSLLSFSFVFPLFILFSFSFLFFLFLLSFSFFFFILSFSSLFYFFFSFCFIFSFLFYFFLLFIFLFFFSLLFYFVCFIQCLCIIKSAPAWDRTMDLTVNSRSLCQLSHRSLYSSWSGFIYTLRDIVIKQWTEVMNNKLGWNIKG